MSDRREPGASELPSAIVHPGVPQPPARHVAGIGTRGTLIVMAAALVLGIGAWFATRGGAADEDDDGGFALGGLARKKSDGADFAIRQMGKLADELCACKDMDCADGVMKKMSALREPSGKPTTAQMERAMKIAEKMAGCQKKLFEADLPSDLVDDVDDAP